MFKVVCVNEGYAPSHLEHAKLKKGNIYNVIEQKNTTTPIWGGVRCSVGTYYKLIECGKIGYHSSLFVKINDDQQDETEFIREQTQKESV